MESGKMDIQKLTTKYKVRKLEGADIEAVYELVQERYTVILLEKGLSSTQLPRH